MKYVKSCLIIIMLLGVGYSQDCDPEADVGWNCDCNEDTWQEYYNSEGHNMEGCYLVGADIQGAFLVEADLHDANLAYANLQGAYLAGAWLPGADLQGAFLSWGNLAGANLSGADLSYAYLVDTILAGANLSGADLSYAYLINTFLSGVELAEANLCNLFGSPSGDVCEQPDGITDNNGDGYDDVSYEAGYIAGHSDGVVFGMESVDITIDNQAVCVDCYADGEASVDTNSDGLVDEFPVITILGEDVLILTQTSDEEYTDEGATCYAGETNLYSSVEVSGQVVNMSNIGTYIITYNCSDTEGNQAMSKSRTVIVQADYSDEDDDGHDDVSYDAGAESGDLNLDGIDNVLDVVLLVDNILNP